MKIAITIAYVLAFVMTVLNYAPSFSQLADTVHEYLLYSFLGAVSTGYFLRNNKYDKIVAIMFIIVGVFSVNSEVKWVEILHLIFTGLAILMAYVSMIASAETLIVRISAYASISIGAALFAFGYLFGWYTVAVAELLVATPLLIPFYKK